MPTTSHLSLITPAPLRDVSPVSPNPLPQASLPSARLRAPPGRSPVPAWRGQGTGPGLGTPGRKLAEIDPGPSLSLQTPRHMSLPALLLSCSLPSLLRHICLALKSFSLSLSSLSHSLLGPKSWLCITCCINLSRGQNSHRDRGHLKLFSLENPPGEFTKCRFPAPLQRF